MAKKTLVLGVLLLVGIAFSSSVLSAASNSKKTITITVDFPKPVISKAGEYDRISMEGINSLGNPGEPILPVKPARILLPPAGRVVSCRVIPGKKITLPGTYTIEPGQKAYPLSFQGKIEKTPPKDSIYQSNMPFPAERKRHLFTQKKKGYRVAVVNLHPIEYRPAAGEISYYDSLILRIDTQSPPPGLLRRSDLPRGLSRDRKELTGFVDNPRDVSSYDAAREQPGENSGPRGSMPVREGSPLDPDDSYQYVIITNYELKNANGDYTFQDLISSKLDKGMSATIVTVEEITDVNGYNYSGVDLQDKIRNFIRDAYNDWETDYILLGGDGDGGDAGGESGDNIIPARGFFCAGVDDNIPADLYYACLDGTFNYDGDQHYGEPHDGENGGEVDLYAEVYVGRAPVDSAAEVSNFVKKTLAYENSTSSSLGRIYMVGEHLGFHGDAEFACTALEELCQGTFVSEDEVTTKGFTSETTHRLYDYDYDPVSAHYRGGGWDKNVLIDIINSGVHVLNHLGHAQEYRVMKLFRSDADAELSNDDYFFGYSQGCYPGAFDNRRPLFLGGKYSPYDCVVEHLITNPTGAFAFVANSRFGWGKSDSTDGPSHFFNRELWDAVFDEQIYNLGKINQDSKEDNDWNLNRSHHRYCYYELNLFGDPELSLRCGASLGKVKFDRDFYNVSTAEISVSDIDLNVEPDIQETIDVGVSSSGDEEDVTLTETSNDSGIFQGTIELVTEGDPGLLVSDGETITVTYNDVNDGFENSVEVSDTAVIDLTPPEITSIAAHPRMALYPQHGQASCEIAWQTDENSTSKVYYGKDPADLDQIEENPTGICYFATEHSLVLTGLDTSDTYYYKVESTDRSGNTTVDDNSGQLYQFSIIPPDLEISTTYLSFDVIQGESASDEPVISNLGSTGCVDLEVEFVDDWPYWLSVSPDTGIIPEGDDETFIVSLNVTNTQGWDPGSYTRYLQLYSNDPDTQEASVSIQVDINISAAPVLDYTFYSLIDDWSKGSYFGDGDNWLDPGERAALAFELHNWGNLPAQGVTATLTTDDDHVTVVINDEFDNVVSFGDFAAGSKNTNPDDNFLIEADPDTPDGHLAEFNLLIEADGNWSWESSFSLLITKDFSVARQVGDELSYEICCDDSGHIYVLWQGQSEDQDEIHFNSSSDFGATWQGAKKINTSKYKLEDMVMGALSPKIACDNSGHVYVIWRGGKIIDESTMTIIRNVYFTYSSNYGKTWHEEVQLSNYGDDDPVDAFCCPAIRIAADDNGNVYVHWLHCSEDAYNEVCFARSDNYGRDWYDAQVLETMSGSSQWPYKASSDLSADDNGKVYLLYASPELDELRCLKSENYGTGGSWSTPQAVHTGSDGTITELEASSDESGNVYVVWRDYHESDSDIYLKYSQNSGDSWQPQGDVHCLNTASGAMPKVPQICSDESGNVYVVWQDDRSGNYDIYLNYSENCGQNWQSSDIRLDTDSAGAALSEWPRICCDNSGYVYAVWADFRLEGLDSYCNYSFDYGQNWQEEDVRLAPEDTGATITQRPQIACDDSGRLFVIRTTDWYETPDLYFFNYNANLSEFVSPIGDKSTPEDTELSFEVEATTASGMEVTITFDVSELAPEEQSEFATATLEKTSYDEVTGITTYGFSWTPDSDSVGVYNPVVFKVENELQRFAWEGITIEVTDVIPPSPDPMQWLVPAYALSPDEISMTAAEAVDVDSPPVEYYFESVNGHSRDWESGRVYNDTGLNPNTSYDYKVKARDSAATPNETGYSSEVNVYTWAAVPGAPQVDNPTPTTLDIEIVDTGGNPVTTGYAIYNATSGYYLSAAGGNNGGTPVWQTASAWDVVTATGLSAHTSYAFRVKARNGDGIETALSAPGEETTANTAPVLDSVAINPSEADTRTDLAAVPGDSSDADGDDVTLEYEWKKGENVLGTAGTLAHGNFVKGDQIQLVCTPYDGYDYGDPKEANITIANSPPSRPGVEISPSAAAEDDDLVAEVTMASTDPDEADTISYTYKWRSGEGTLVEHGPTTGTTDTLDASNTQVGTGKLYQEWRCSVVPDDGDVDGAPGRAGVFVYEFDAVYYVDGTSGSDSNPGTSDAPFATIGKGVETANACATGAEFTAMVVVRADTYNEGIVVGSLDDYYEGPVPEEVPDRMILHAEGQAVVDAAGYDHGFRIERPQVVFNGFRITGADDSGVYLMQDWTDHITFKGCEIYANGVHGVGGIPALDSYDHNFEDCLIYDNVCSGIYFNDDSSLGLKNCCVYNNGTYGVHTDGASFDMYNCTIAGNGYRGVECETFSALQNNIFASNGGTGIYAYYAPEDYAFCNNYWNNGLSADDGQDWMSYSGDGLPGLFGTIEADPEFVSGFYLQPTSPCIDAGSGTAENNGLSDRTTQTDETADSGQVDVGYHYPIGASGCVLYLALENNAQDSSSRGNDGILYGFDPPVWTDGKVGNALTLDGVDDFISVRDDASLEVTDSITVEAWIKPDTLANQAVMKSAGGDGQTAGWRITIEENQEIAVTVYVSAGQPETVQRSAGLTAGAWYHLAFTYDGSYVRVYGDGSLLGDPYALTGDIYYDDDSDLRIGYCPAVSYFKGVVDEVKVYDRVLSADEIGRSYEGVTPPPIATLSTSANPEESGSVSADPDQPCYAQGTEVTIAADAEPGEEFSHWSGDIGGSQNPKLITIIQDTAVTANFSSIEYTLSTSVSPAGSGSVTRNPNQSTYHYNDTVTLTGNPASGYEFSHWTGDVGGSSNPEEITITKNSTAQAHFTYVGSCEY